MNSSMEQNLASLTEEDLKNMTPDQLRELQRKNCIFCQIISGKVQSKKVFEDEKSIAILDINPANPGHVLLMPKEHATIMPQISDIDIGYLFLVAKSLSKSGLKALKAEGSNIFVANSIAAGQKSPHFMIHIITRKANDGIAGFGLLRRKMAKEELQAVQQAILKRSKESMPGNKAELILSLEAPKEPEKLEAKEQPPAIKFDKQKPKHSVEIRPAEETKGPEQSDDEGSIDLDDIARVLGRK